MARLIQKSGYIQGGRAARYMEYVAKRDGVEVIQSTEPVTKKQMQFLTKLLKDFPGAKELFEYSDYLQTPNRGTASAFIAAALDTHLHELESESGYMVYLTKHRCIDRDVVTAFVQEKLLYEDDPHHNCVFVGLDENGEARHAHLRSTGSQGKVFRINVESSDIKHSFHKNGTDRSLYVFEAPIDLLSHITLYPAGWLEHSYVACCGTSIQPVLERLRQNPKLDTVYLCLDNDEAGEDACDGMLDTLEDMGYDVERLRPEGKDWNDDLRAKRGGHG